MRNTLRKIVLATTITMFCALIGVSAYVATKNLTIIQNYTAQRLDAADVQSDIVAVELDLEAIETGQQGYLLTGDAAYLTPYSNAVEHLPAHFSALRSRLAGRPSAERSVESDLEQVAEAKIGEVNETIRLRQKGYRHRAFLVVDSNRGKELMDKARALLAQMSIVESRNIELHDRELASSIVTARNQSAFAGVVMVVLTVITLVAFHQSRKRLDLAYERQTAELGATRHKLEQLTSTISTSVRATAVQMQSHAESLLNVHGGFLPRQGQERAQWIHEGSRQISRVLADLLGDSSEDVAEGFAGPCSAEPAEEPRRQSA